MRLVAKKRLHYPSGPAGREYQPGETFDALSERDAKALKLVGKAEDAPAPTPRRREAKAVAAPAPEAKPTRAQSLSTATAESLLDPPEYYRRRDMRPED